MTYEIGSDVIVAAFVFVAILFAVASVPNILFTIFRVVTGVSKHKRASMLSPSDEIPNNLEREWELRKDGAAYQKEISFILERIGSLRTSIYRAAMSSILIAILLVWPGFTSDVEIPMLIACLILFAIWIGAIVLSLKCFMDCITLLEEKMPHSEHPRNMYG